MKKCTVLPTQKDVDASWEKVIDSLKSMSQIRLANQLKEKYCSSDSDPLAISAVCPAKPAKSSPEKELIVDRQEFLEMETLGDNYLQLVMEAESAAMEESDPPLKKLKRFSQCFMRKENINSRRTVRSTETILLPRIHNA